ncbi:MAG: MFS transporter, partial [Chloroflexi bacterium]|nr:MFS transporter [Chloroflexota bacterium]
MKQVRTIETCVLLFIHHSSLAIHHSPFKKYRPFFILLGGSGNPLYTPTTMKKLFEFSENGRVLAVIGLGTALSLIGDASMYTVLPTHTAEAGIALAAVGVMLSANRWIRLVANGAVGWLSERWSRRWLFVPALFLGAISTAVYGWTVGYWPLLIGRLLWGISWSGIWVAGNAIVLDISQAHNRGRLVGLYNVAFFAGAGAGSFVGGALTDWLGYAAMFRVAALLTLIGAIVAWLFLPETRHSRQKR